ncbi:MAG TPA: hypothetical protein PKD91_02050 [Bacteroidia bacterium]|nr:hypothetical protein [Bacteroidia bacterium]
MKKEYQKFIYGVLLLSLLTACAPTVKVTGSWKNPQQEKDKKYSKIFVLAITGNGAIRESLENELGAAALKRGFEVVKSMDAFQNPASGTLVIKKEDLMNKVRELGCDGIITFAVLDQKEESRYVPGNLSYNPIGYGFYDVFNSYYNYWSPVVYTSGYFSNDKYYYLESNFFDASSEKLIWSVQSETLNPSGLSKFSKQYTTTLVDQLKKDNVIKQ